jgi:hypothetical protein
MNEFHSPLVLSGHIFFDAIRAARRERTQVIDLVLAYLMVRDPVLGIDRSFEFGRHMADVRE